MTSTHIVNHGPDARQRKRAKLIRYFKQNWVLYLLLVPALLDLFVFKYGPMYGIQIAFRKYKASKGILGSDWVGLKYFIQFIEMPDFWKLIKNTFLLSFYSLVFGFPVPIILAFMLNELNNLRLKKIAQTLTYMPHFISMVAIVGLIDFMCNRSSGMLNVIGNALGFESVNYLGSSAYFRAIYVISGIWQEAGWGSIIYIAALAGTDQEVIEAARIDGANRFQKIRYIDFPMILPTIVVMLVLRSGSLLSAGFEKVFLLQNDLTRDVSEIISTYTYRLGILNGQFSYTTAIGLFNSVVNAAILLLVNSASRRISGSSLW